MKKWFSEWFLVDIVALGTALLLLIGYIVGYDSLEPDSPFANLLPNVATEVLGVWIGVRVIDQIIKRRQRYHQMRQTLLDDVVSVRYQLDRFFPASLYTSLDPLYRALGWINEKSPVYRRHLSADEQEALERNLILAADAVTQCRVFNEHLKLNNECEQNFRKITVSITSWRNNLREYLQDIQYQMYPRLLDTPGPLGPWPQALAMLLTRIEHSLSMREREMLTTMQQEMRGDGPFTHLDVDRIISPLRHFDPSMYYGAILWHVQLEEAVDLIALNPLETEEKWKELLTQATAGIEETRETLPTPIIQAGEELLRDTIELGEYGLKSILAIALHDQQFDEMRRNIEFESM